MPNLKVTKSSDGRIYEAKIDKGLIRLFYDNEGVLTEVKTYPPRLDASVYFPLLTAHEQNRSFSYFDRNPISVFEVEWATRAPHGLTTRWTYTVPERKKLMVEAIDVCITRITAAVAAGEAYGGIQIWKRGEIAAEGMHMRTLFDNTVGANVSSTGGGGYVLYEGDRILAATADASNAGTINYLVSMIGTTFDA